MWPDCFNKGIAAIGYYTGKNNKPVVTDCSKLSLAEYGRIWREKLPSHTTDKASLHRLAYEMKPKNIIYVREGTSAIVGKGKIISGYKYDPDILKGTPMEWEHYVRVEWERDFPRLKLNLPAPQLTVFELKGEHLREIQTAEKRERKTYKNQKKMEVEEGEKYIAEVEFRKRNAALIAQKKRESNYRCEVCSMSFQETYGDIGKEHIIAHHLNPIAMRKEPSKTTLDDLALVCSNCHDMLHREEPPITLEKLRKIIEEQKLKRNRKSSTD